MMNSSISVRLKKGKTYFALGGVALIALLSSSSWLHAIKSLEEIEKEEASHARCLHLDEKAHRKAALETREENALNGNWQAKLEYLKEVAEFLKEDPSYRPVLSQSDESSATFFKNLHAQARTNLSASELPQLEKDFERTRLNFFYDRVKNHLSGETEKPVHWEIQHSLQSIQLAICGEGNHLPTHSPGIADAIQSRAEIYAGLHLRVLSFKEYLSKQEAR